MLCGEGCPPARRGAGRLCIAFAAAVAACGVLVHPPSTSSRWQARPPSLGPPSLRLSRTATAVLRRPRGAAHTPAEWPDAGPLPRGAREQRDRLTAAETRQRRLEAELEGAQLRRRLDALRVQWAEHRAAHPNRPPGRQLRAAVEHLITDCDTAAEGSVRAAAVALRRNLGNAGTPSAGARASGAAAEDSRGVWNWEQGAEEWAARGRAAWEHGTAALKENVPRAADALERQARSLAASVAEAYTENPELTQLLQPLRDRAQMALQEATEATAPLRKQLRETAHNVRLAIRSSQRLAQAAGEIDRAKRRITAVWAKPDPLPKRIVGVSVIVAALATGCLLGAVAFASGLVRRMVDFTAEWFELSNPNPAAARRSPRRQPRPPEGTGGALSATAPAGTGRLMAASLVGAALSAVALTHPPGPLPPEATQWLRLPSGPAGEWLSRAREALAPWPPSSAPFAVPLVAPLP